MNSFQVSTGGRAGKGGWCYSSCSMERIKDLLELCVTRCIC